MIKKSRLILYPTTLLALCACLPGRPITLTPEENAIYRHSSEDCESTMLGRVDGASTVSEAVALKQVLSKAALIGASGIVIHSKRVEPRGQFTHVIDASAYRCIG